MYVNVMFFLLLLLIMVDVVMFHNLISPLFNCIYLLLIKRPLLRMGITRVWGETGPITRNPFGATIQLPLKADSFFVPVAGAKLTS
jgi:hypothetical protein